MKIYPVEILDNLADMNRASKHILFEDALDSDDEETHELAQKARDDQEEYLLGQGLSQEDCDTLLEAVKKHNLMDFKPAKSVGTAIIILLICFVATALLAHYNYHLYTETTYGLSFLPIVGNIVTLLGTLFFLFVAIISAHDSSKLKHEIFSKCPDVARIDEIKRFANYLVTYHRYNAEALSLYLCLFQLDEIDIAIVLKQMGLTLTEIKH